ncbi:MAG: phosphate ABC transporter ATP-binding protein PstB [Phycisphaerae bacterium]
MSPPKDPGDRDMTPLVDEQTKTHTPEAAEVKPAEERISMNTELPAASELSDASEQGDAIIESREFCLYYGEKAGVKNINMEIYAQAVTAIIGPSGCGKSTFLRSINRMNDLVPSARAEGSLMVNGVDVYDKRINLVNLRQEVGMVFQRPNPFPKSIYDNIAFGPRLQGVRKRGALDEIVERCLRDAALWNEVKDELKKSALALSGGQQQRLCIARALATEPTVLLMDEPCSALDPVATGHIEELIIRLKNQYTIVIVTHNMQQAARVSDRTAFFCMGDLIEYGLTRDLFTRPKEKQTEDYITGRFG